MLVREIFDLLFFLRLLQVCLFMRWIVAELLGVLRPLEARHSFDLDGDLNIHFVVESVRLPDHPHLLHASDLFLEKHLLSIVQVLLESIVLQLLHFNVLEHGLLGAQCRRFTLEVLLALLRQQSFAELRKNPLHDGTTSIDESIILLRKMLYWVRLSIARAKCLGRPKYTTDLVESGPIVALLRVILSVGNALRSFSDRPHATHVLT